MLRVARRRLTSELNMFAAGSESHFKMERCIDHSVKAGVDLFEKYEPFLPLDIFQTAVVTVEHLLPLGGWPLAIAVTAVTMRAIICPLQIWSLKKASEQGRITKRTTAIMTELQSAKKGRAEAKAAALQKEYYAISAGQSTFSPMKGLVGGIVGAGSMLSALFALRGMAAYPTTFPSFALSDPFWLDSLCLPDPLYILPVTSAALFLTNFELTGKLDSGAAKSSHVAKSAVTQEILDKLDSLVSPDSRASFGKNAIRALIVGSLFASTSFPAGSFFFFIPNSILSITQNHLLQLPRFRAYFELDEPVKIKIEAKPKRDPKALTVEGEVERIRGEKKLATAARLACRSFGEVVTQAEVAETYKPAITSFVAARKVSRISRVDSLP